MNEHEFLGIDVSKGYADLKLLDKNKQPIEKSFQLDDNRSGHEQLIETYTNSNLALLTTIRGVGDWTAAAILILLGETSRFTDTHQLASFFGVHPVFKQSGDAPISRSNYKKRKAAMECQLSENDKITVSSKNNLSLQT